MKSIALLLTCFLCASAPLSFAAGDITGAGSTAAAPLYIKWKAAYTSKIGNKVEYQSVGSSAGIKKMKENSVDFAASDAPMSLEELKKINMLAFPTVISGVVPFVNLPGVRVGELRLSAETLVGIYSGKITKWNDALIEKENPQLHLPNLAVVPLVRADGSGTTFTFSDYLSRVSPEWKQKFGTNFTIAWPANVVAAKGSSGMVDVLKKTPGSIGYTEYAYIIENSLNYVQLKNHDGLYVKPNAASFRVALANSSWTKTGQFEEMLTDKAGAGSWPITGSTYIYVPRVTNQPERTASVLQFFTWAFMNGDLIADSLDFIRLPDLVQARVVHEIGSVVDTHGNKLHVEIGLN